MLRSFSKPFLLTSLCLGAACLSVPAFAQQDAAGAEPAAAESDSPAETADEASPPASVEQPETPEAETDGEAEAAEPPAGPQPDPVWAEQNVWTEVPSEGPVAEDYALVGEFSGELTEGEAKRAVSLQVTSLGDGQFRGNWYGGSLPGIVEGGSMADPAVVRGARGGTTVVLAGQDRAVFVSPESCVVVSPTAGVVGELARVRRTSTTLGAAPPEGAVVLFDGSSTDQFTKAEATEAGILRQGAEINYLLTDFDLHAEFRIPFMPDAREQARGNSGLYLQGRYECQVLDSFGLDRVFNGLGAIYRTRKPAINMALPPLVWQTYDVRFTAARFNVDGSKRRPAHLTSYVNGVLVQDDVAIETKTGHGKDEGAEPLPTRLQDHKDPVRYRNVWVIDRGIAGAADFPVRISG